MNRRQTGSQAEQLAGRYLEKQGYEIIQYNFRCRQAEIDIVAREDRFLVFVEVKWRSSGRNGAPEEAVDRRKQARILRAALFYFARYRLPEDTPVRFDVVAIEGTQIRLVKNAFTF